MEKARYKPRLGYDIRIKRETGKPAAKTRRCAVPGCLEDGICNTPISPHNLLRRVWLCPDHAREHNENWDFFSGMSDQEIAQFQEEALVGHRPTWPLGKRGTAKVNGFADGAYIIEDGYAVFAGETKKPEPRRPTRVLTPLQRQAFDILDLESSASLNEIKARYKELVKRFHPDAHGGDRGTEERLKQVIKAYGVLRASGLT
jgi:hypothetical protein